MQLKERIGRDIAHEWGIKYEGNEKAIENSRTFSAEMMSHHIDGLKEGILEGVLFIVNWIKKVVRKT